jgi:hypothetical protein
MQSIEEELNLLYTGDNPIYAEDVYEEIAQYVKPSTIRNWAYRIERITKKIFYRGINEKNVYYHKDGTVNYDYIFLEKDVERFVKMVALRKEGYSVDSAIYHTFLLENDYDLLKKNRFDFTIFWDDSKKKLLAISNEET